MSTPSTTPTTFPCNNSEYLTNILISQCLNTTQLGEVKQSTDDVKCKFVLTSIDCVLDKIQEKFNLTCSEADKTAAAKEFSSVVQSSIGINPEICITPSTSLPPPMMTTTAMKIISPCDNSEYLTNTLINQCLNTTQISEVSQSTDDDKCNFVLASIDCVLDQIQKEHNVTCSEADKNAAAKEFSSVVQSSIGISPEICLIPSTSGPPPLMTTTTKIINPCNNSEYLTNTLLAHCFNTSQLSEVSQSTDNVKCKFVIASIDCVLNQIQMDFNITCSEADTMAAAKEFSSIVQASIGINPEICLSTSPLTPTSTHMANVTTGTVTQLLTTKTAISTSETMTTKIAMLSSETMTTMSLHTSPSSPTTRTTMAMSSTETTRTTPSLTTATTSPTTTSSLPETLTTLSPTSSSTTRKTTIFIPTIMTTTTLSPTTTKVTILSKETTTTSSPTKMTTTMAFPTTTTTFSSPTTTTSKPLPTTITMSKITTSSPITSSTMTTEMVSSTAKSSPSSPPTLTSMLSPTTIRTTSTTLSSTISTTLSPTTSTALSSTTSTNT
ncbi:mucin-2-like [Saccostrea echinata]|uniref:mucin-2-like n=1 Tax=Saccostrea echinata TaxID=191078 RepID=UPI002A8296FA|nr:mucin-2-like [Saccostrea echinata]